MDCHPAQSEEDCLHKTILDSAIWLDSNGTLHNPNDSKDEWEGDNQSDVILDNNSDN